MGKIGQPITLREYIKQCADDDTSLSEWMVNEFKDKPSYSLDMLLCPVIIDTSEMSVEEYEKAEKEIHSLGYFNCLNPDQLVDILDNLAAQKPWYSDKDLEDAINYYSEHDTFVSIPGETKASFTVVLTSFSSKLEAIKAVKLITGLGLKEAKDILEKTPFAIKEVTSKEEAEEIKKILVASGASAEIRRVKN